MHNTPGMEEQTMIVALVIAFAGGMFCGFTLRGGIKK